jgi:hypothetical protein
MNIVWIIAAILVIVGSVNLIAQSIIVAIRVTKGELTAGEGFMRIAVSALLVILAIVFFLQINAAVVVSETSPYLLTWVNGLLESITTGNGLPMLRP